MEVSLVAHKIVAQHGGELTAENAERGARFRTDSLRRREAALIAFSDFCRVGVE